MTYKAEFTAALKAAKAAGAIQIEQSRNLLNIEKKDDRSPVTQVDKACEACIRDILLSAFPTDGFLGEETGAEKGGSGRRWIVDPLDGTRPYIRGIPTYSVLIALEDGEELVVGIIHLPALGQTYHAYKGAGAFLNNETIHVSSITAMSRSMGSALGFIEKAGTTDANNLLRAMGSWDYAYGFMDAFSYGGVAAGRLDVCVNLLDKPWDCASAACIVSEAGGRFSDIHGNPSIYNGSVVLSNGLLHNAVLEYFQD